MKTISKMDGQELINLAEELGGYNSETFEESEKRFRDNGDFETAGKFHAMTSRWFEIS
jgi:hypothetical protein